MDDKVEKMMIKDKKIKRLIKKGNRAATEQDFFELLKRAVKGQKQA